MSEVTCKKSRLAINIPYGTCLCKNIIIKWFSYLLGFELQVVVISAGQGLLDCLNCYVIFRVVPFLNVLPHTVLYHCRREKVPWDNLAPPVRTDWNFSGDI